MVVAVDGDDGEADDAYQNHFPGCHLVGRHGPTGPCTPDGGAGLGVVEGEPTGPDTPAGADELELELVPLGTVLSPRASADNDTFFQPATIRREPNRSIPKDTDTGRPRSL